MTFRTKFANWNDPRLRQLGEQFAGEAYELAAELHSYGADAGQLLLSRHEKADRPWNVEIPPALADALMAVLLSLPRAGASPGRRCSWSKRSVQALINTGMSLHKAATVEAARARVSVDAIERGMRAWRAINKRHAKKQLKQPSKRKPRQPAPELQTPDPSPVK
jgi:hypothetical protein